MSKSTPDQENRRRVVRRPSSTEASICYGPQGSVCVPCTIRNIGAGGALLEASEVSLLPLVFRLEDPRQGLAFDCKVAWRRGNQVGVSFVRTIDLKPKPGLGARALQTVRSLVKP